MDHDPHHALTPDQLRGYLSRVGFEGPPPADDAGLAALHRAHHYTFPFENFDVHLPERVRFETDALYEKMVGRRRGGFCYEQNLFFLAAIRALGFEANPVQGQIAGKHGTFGDPFDHMALVVRRPGGDVMADVGNGETLQRPVALDGEWHEQERPGAYRALDRGDTWLMEHRDTEGKVEVRYRFDLLTREPEAFREMCTFHCTSPKSRFTKGWIATLPVGVTGRITVSRGMRMETVDGKMDRRAIHSPEELTGILVEEFGMVPFAVPERWFRRDGNR